MPAFDSRIAYPPVVTLITETRDVTPRGTEEGEMPARYLPCPYRCHLHAEQPVGSPSGGHSSSSSTGWEQTKRQGVVQPHSSQIASPRADRAPVPVRGRTDCAPPRRPEPLPAQPGSAGISLRSLPFAAATCTWNFFIFLISTSLHRGLHLVFWGRGGGIIIIILPPLRAPNATLRSTCK